MEETKAAVEMKLANLYRLTHSTANADQRREAEDLLAKLAVQHCEICASTELAPEGCGDALRCGWPSREDLINRCKSDVFFLGKSVLQKEFLEQPHRLMCDFYVQKQPHVLNRPGWAHLENPATWGEMSAEAQKESDVRYQDLALALIEARHRDVEQLKTMQQS